MSAEINKNKLPNILVFAFLSATVIGIILYFIYDHYTKKNLVKNVDGNTNVTTTNGTYTGSVDVDKVLHKGDSGANIVQLQMAINDKIKMFNSPMTPLVADGIYGNATETTLENLVVGRFASDKNNVTIRAVRSLMPIGITVPTYSGTKINLQQPYITF